MISFHFFEKSRVHLRCKNSFSELMYKFDLKTLLNFFLTVGNFFPFPIQFMAQFKMNRNVLLQLQLNFSHDDKITKDDINLQNGIILLAAS